MMGLLWWIINETGFFFVGKIKGLTSCEVEIVLLVSIWMKYRFVDRKLLCVVKNRKGSKVFD